MDKLSGPLWDGGLVRFEGLRALRDAGLEAGGFRAVRGATKGRCHLESCGL